jgi:hypothetical protein
LFGVGDDVHGRSMPQCESCLQNAFLTLERRLDPSGPLTAKL